MNVCPECDDHWYVPARQRIAQVLDEGTFEERFTDLTTADPLGFIDRVPYPQRIEQEQKRTGLREAAVVGTGMIRARRVAFGVTDSGFIMGSMGAVVGEKTGADHRSRRRSAVAADYHFRLRRRRADARRHPFAHANGEDLGRRWRVTIRPAGCSFRCSRTRRWAAWRPVSPRWATVVFAEPNAMVGFAGPRTIKATIRMELPKGFQTSEFLLAHGYIDRIVRRKDLKSELARTIDYCGK